MSQLDFWRGKRVFLTGHTGFKGAWLSKILEISGAEVFGYALAPPPLPNLYAACKPQIHSITGDIRDFEALSTAYQNASPEIIFHMAAQPLVLQSYLTPRSTYETNVMGTVNLLECARLHSGARSILNVTTDKVYLNRERAEGYHEEEMLGGHDPYSSSKSCSELLTSSYNRSFFRQAGIAISTARSGNVIGGGDFSANRLIPDCARAAAAGKTIKIRHPESVRPYQHVLDTLFAYLLIAERQYQTSSLAGSYNIGPSDQEHVTSGRLADMFCEAWANGAHWTHVPLDSPHESGLLTLTCSKIRQTLGWKPHWNIRESVKASTQWYKAYYSACPGSESAVAAPSTEASALSEANAVMLKQIEEFRRITN